jgi:hypothetical protein
MAIKTEYVNNLLAHARTVVAQWQASQGIGTHSPASAAAEYAETFWYDVKHLEQADAEWALFDSFNHWAETVDSAIKAHQKTA